MSLIPTNVPEKNHCRSGDRETRRGKVTIQELFAARRREIRDREKELFSDDAIRRMQEKVQARLHQRTEAETHRPGVGNFLFAVRFQSAVILAVIAGWYAVSEVLSAHRAAVHKSASVIRAASQMVRDGRKLAALDQTATVPSTKSPLGALKHGTARPWFSSTDRRMVSCLEIFVDRDQRSEPDGILRRGSTELGLWPFPARDTLIRRWPAPDLVPVETDILGALVRIGSREIASTLIAYEALENFASIIDRSPSGRSIPPMHNALDSIGDWIAAADNFAVDGAASEMPAELPKMHLVAPRRNHVTVTRLGRTRSATAGADVEETSPEVQRPPISIFVASDGRLGLDTLEEPDVIPEWRRVLDEWPEVTASRPMTATTGVALATMRVLETVSAIEDEPAVYRIVVREAAGSPTVELVLMSHANGSTLDSAARLAGRRQLVFRRLVSREESSQSVLRSWTLERVDPHANDSANDARHSRLKVRWIRNPQLASVSCSSGATGFDWIGARLEDRSNVELADAGKVARQGSIEE